MKRSVFNFAPLQVMIFKQNECLCFFSVTSRRGDLEILGYVMLQWLCGRLPWENHLENKEYVGNEKMR